MYIIIYKCYPNNGGEPNMYTLFIYNNESNRLERYNLHPYSNLPYATHSSLSVSEFFSNTSSSAGWTSTEFIRKWNCFSKGQIRPEFVFRRIWEGGYICESMHYAGLAADTLSDSNRDIFPFTSQNHVSLFPYGYPDLSFGDIGLFVLVMQDALSALGFTEGELDGFFGPRTLSALTRFRHLYGLAPGSACDRQTWRALTFHACGCGITPHCKYVFKNKVIL